MKTKLLRIWKRLQHNFASPLPRTVYDFDSFCDDILEVHGLPDNPSYRQAMASAIMHLGPVTDKAPKVFFAKSVKKAMANHAAFDKIQQLKEAEKAFMQRANGTADPDGLKTVQSTGSEVVSQA